MIRTQKIVHKGKMIYHMDFSYLTTNQEIQDLIIESALFIRSQPVGSLLTLTNLEGMHFNNETKEMFNNFLKGNKPYVRSGAVVGLNGLQTILYNALMKISGRDVKSFSSDVHAKDWLASVS